MKKPLITIFTCVVIIVLGLLMLVPATTRCGVAYVTVLTPDGAEKIRVGLDTLDFFGSEIQSDSLVSLIEKKRNKQNDQNFSDEEWRRVKYKKKYYKIDRAINALILAEHPETLNLAKGLLYGSYFSARAPDYLVKIGGDEAADALLYAWNRIGNHDTRYMFAALQFKDPRAVPFIIDSIGRQYHTLDKKLEVIEEISGESLEHMVDPIWTHHSSMDQLKSDLWSWWIEYKTKHKIKSI